MTLPAFAAEHVHAPHTSCQSTCAADARTQQQTSRTLLLQSTDGRTLDRYTHRQ